MKKYAAITLLAATLVGCDNNSAPLSFTPEMASFSNEFDF
ncbi:YnfC family lipoprotein, partial [Enterobacter kobei]